jgi:N-acetylmuramoyl-L-alanine amidase
VIRTNLPHQWVASPNVEPRRGNHKPTILLIHYTGMRSAEIARAWLCNPQSRVSCHYLVDEAGRIVQMVDESMRAWHAGLASWKRERDINSASVGIEVQNPGHSMGYPDFPEPQVRAVGDLCRDIITRHAIRSELVLGHSDVAPGRKVDPGEKFDWRSMHAMGVGHWVEPAHLDEGDGLRVGAEGEAVEALQRSLHDYGYGIGVSGRYDAGTETVVKAFQRHFRQAKIDGNADASTLDTLRRLTAALQP